MFHFFSRKFFLIDYLEGFVDIHNHILHGLDDGAKTVEDSIEMIRAFSEIGIKNFIATPHIMHSYYPNTPETINKSLTILKNELLKNGMRDISIQAAAEHMIDGNFESILADGTVMPLPHHYLLVEMSYLQPSINFDEAILKISSNNYSTILAHPERYVYLHTNFKKYNKYKEKGILFQLNLLSLSDYYGKKVQQMAIKLLERGLIDYLGSDIHNINQLNSLKEIKVTSKVLKTLLPIIENTNQTF
ncbi:MAG: CpsB/CapC family capsule biosynthesis tyrosine phosphatase [Maribacter sp.]